MIKQFFFPLSTKRDDVLLGIGDDAACLVLPAGMNLLVSTDTLVAGVHFLDEWNAFDIAYRAVMVNVSDLAAMAAKPCWATLALTLPKADEIWLASFARGLKEALGQFGISLVGGDTTKGPLSINLTVFGHARQGQELRRSGAQPGDVILVSGHLGAAALAINTLAKKDMPKADRNILMEKLLYPKPRTDLTPFLQSYATAAIDLSDGLSADLNHINEASDVGACLELEKIPVHPLLDKYCPAKAVDLALSGGDDYELCFTVAEKKLAPLMEELKKANLVCYPVGVIETEPGLRMKNAEGGYECFSPQGYSHF